jgi:hypothetical protein
LKKKLFLFALFVSVIFINDAFAQDIGSVGSKEAKQYPLEITIVPASGSGSSGCESLTEGCYIPKEATVAIGGKVIFSNTDVVTHTFTASTADGTSGLFDSSLVIAGGSYEWMPTTTGEFPYYCMVHPWMIGVIVVGEEKDNPTDIDGDSIFDSSDSCPTDPETVNGFQDEEGCPDVVIIQDLDKDGIIDGDVCPRSPETFNGFQDEDGCPDNSPITDTDGDGILDTLDSCPTQAETINEFEDEDGCPDKLPVKDSDNDGILDDYDKCPIQSEIKNNYQDTDGCPDEIVTDKNDDPVLVYAVIGIGIAGAATAIGIKLHGKGSGGKEVNKVESDNHDDDQDASSHVEVRITGGIE